MYYEKAEEIIRKIRSFKKRLAIGNEGGSYSGSTALSKSARVGSIPTPPARQKIAESRRSQTTGRAGDFLVY